MVSLDIKEGCVLEKKDEWRDKILKEMHDSSIGGHSDMLGTYSNMSSLVRFVKWESLNMLRALSYYNLLKYQKGLERV
jgi:hypothetical protein